MQMNCVIRTKGFTLLELMVTIAIVAILLAIGVPSFQSFIMNNRLTAQANDFVSALNLARSEAIKRASAISITATSSTASNEFGNGWSVKVTSNNEVLRTHDTLQGSNTLDSVDNVTTIQFQSTGTIGANRTFNLCDSRKTGRQIIISTTGRVNMNSNFTCP